MGKVKVVIGAVTKERKSLCHCWIMLGRDCIIVGIYPSIKTYLKAIRPGKKMKNNTIIRIYCTVLTLPSSD